LSAATFGSPLLFCPGTAGKAVFLTVFVYNLLGEAIRDAIDPRLKI